MRKIWTWAAMILTLAICAAAPAQAQLDHTWVASNGVNGNPCSRSQPCADFATAISKTNASSEISCADSGDYGPVTITHAITIDCTGVHASVPGNGSNPIIVTVPGGTQVTLRGLELQRSGSSMYNAILVGQGGIVHVEKCTIHGFAIVAGIYVVPNNEAELYVSDTSITDNYFGVYIDASGGPTVNVALDRA